MFTEISNMTLTYVNNMPITTLLEFLKHCNAQASIANIKLYRMALRCWNCILHKKER